MELDALLEKTGLTPAESRTYRALLSDGPCKAGQLLKKTGLHKATLYACLDRLLEKGLGQFVYADKTRIFEAAPPERLLENLQETQSLLAAALPKLKENARRSAPQATIYVGYEGLKGMCEQMLQRLKGGGTYADFGSGGLFKDVMGPYFHVWQAKKRRWNIRPRVLFDDNVRRKNPQLLKEYFGEARFVPKQYHCPSDTFIFQDTVAVFVWSAQPPFAVVIRNKETAEGYLKIFNWMWTQAKEYPGKGIGRATIESK